MNPITIAWLAEVGIITWRGVKNDKRPPIPSELLSTFVVFGGLTLFGGNPTMSRGANLVAWGLVLATFMNFVDPTKNKIGASSATAAGKSLAAATPK